MATFLCRLGRTAFRRRLLFVLLWVVLLGALGAGAATAPAAEGKSDSMPGIESQKAFDLLEQRFPGTAANGASSRVVFVAPGGQKVTAADHRAAIEKFVSEAADGSQVSGAVDPFKTGAVSKDGSTAYSTVSFGDKADDLTAAGKKHLETAVARVRASGLTFEVGGSALASKPASGGGRRAAEPRRSASRSPRWCYC